MCRSADALPLCIRFYLQDFIFYFSLYHVDSWSLPHQSALLRSYSSTCKNVDCEFIVMLYNLNIFQPFKLSFVTVVDQINAIARFSDCYAVTSSGCFEKLPLFSFFLVSVIAFLFTSITFNLNVSHDGFFSLHSPRFHFF